jgi:hypothetical protein
MPYLSLFYRFYPHPTDTVDEHNVHLFGHNLLISIDGLHDSG